MLQLIEYLRMYVCANTKIKGIDTHVIWLKETYVQNDMKQKVVSIRIPLQLLY